MLTKNTQELSAKTAEHLAADAVVQGQYWEGGRGCFIGCLTHSAKASAVTDQYGIPLPLVHIVERIFEELTHDEAKQFFADIPEAIGCDGKDLSLVHWQFLRETLRGLPAQPPAVQAVIDPVIEGIALLAQGQEWPASAALAAARAASAAQSAAEAEAATRAAEAAARAAEAAEVTAKAAKIAETAKAAAESTARATWSAESTAGAAWAAESTARATWAAWAAWAVEIDEAAAEATRAVEIAETAAEAARVVEISKAAGAVESRRQRDLVLRLIAAAPIITITQENPHD